MSNDTSGSAFVNVQWSQSERANIQALIANRLSYISNYNDEVLPEYVLVMVQNKKTRSQVSLDLEAFLGEKSKDFANWLWEFLIKYEKEGKLPELITQKQSTVTQPESTRGNNYDPEEIFLDEEDSQMEISKNNRELKEQSSQPSQTLSSVVVVRENGRENRRSRFRQPSRYHRSPQRDRHRDHEKKSEIRTSNSRLILSAVKEAAESASKAPRKQHIETEAMDVQTSNKEEEGTEKPSLRRFQRKPRQYSQEKQVNGVHQTEEKEEEEEEVVDDGTTFTVTLSRPPQIRKRKVEKTEPETVSEPIVKKLLIKCAFWPNCAKQETCPYYHPIEPCKNFPHCPFGEKCLFIHPNIPCKFGSACTRPDCTFNHPHPSSIQTQSQTTNSTPCRNGFACTRELCHFTHPKTACRYGKNCARGNSCLFSHAVLCKFGTRCMKPGCTFAHGADVKIPCKFGDKCANKFTCKFYHPEEEEAQMKTLADSLPKTPPRETQQVQTESVLKINLTEDMKDD